MDKFEKMKLINQILMGLILVLVFLLDYSYIPLIGNYIKYIMIGGLVYVWINNKRLGIIKQLIAYVVLLFITSINAYEYINNYIFFFSDFDLKNKILRFFYGKEVWIIIFTIIKFVLDQIERNMIIASGLRYARANNRNNNTNYNNIDYGVMLSAGDVDEDGNDNNYKKLFKDWPDEDEEINIKNNIKLH